MIKEFLKEKYYIFDLETTGLDVDKDKIIEFGSYENFNKKETYFRINPGDRQISEDAFKKHGIKNSDLQNEEMFEYYTSDIAEIIYNSTIAIGYNILKFDVPFLNSEFKRAKNDIDILKSDIVDLIVPVQFYFRHFDSNRLDDVYEAIFEKKETKSHNALVDTLMTKDLLEVFIGTELMPSTTKDFFTKYNKISKIIELERDIFGYWLYFDRENNKKLRIGAGKYRGQLLEEIDKKYIKYVYENLSENLTEQTKKEFKKLI